MICVAFYLFLPSLRNNQKMVIVAYNYIIKALVQNVFSQENDRRA